MVLSALIGFLILPVSADPDPQEPAIEAITVTRPAKIPTYVLFDNKPIEGASGGYEIALGMDVPSGSRVPYSIEVSARDPDTVHLARVGFNWRNQDPTAPASSDVTIRGSVHGPAHSFSEFASGYYQAQYTSAVSNDTQRDVVVIPFTLKGPYEVDTFSGPHVAISMPSIGVNNVASRSTVRAGDPAPLNSELIYHAGQYQNLTGGPSIQEGTNWDWFVHGAAVGITATGVDNAEQQHDENLTFAAAVLFGLAGAAAATFCVELVGALNERRRRVKATS